ncbi:MAG: stealth conserved region 3 domain-containing protein [Kocuria sp.]|nr:stealth conserved region 3 domain-containing protein [Kocuria sp.]
MNSDELRFSLRSVRRYASWVRRIHIVTDGQVPQWLNVAHPKIQVVDHRDLIGGSRFNSHAIESAIHRIPDLAEHYLYMNDDVFFGRIAYPGDFFAAEGISRFFPSDLPIDPGPVVPEDLPIMAAAKNGRDLLDARFGLKVHAKIRHTVHAQVRSVAEQIEQENPEAVEETRGSLFRSPGDLSIASSLHHWYAYALGRAIPAEPNYLYVDLADPNVAQTLDALESLRRYDTFCLNQEESLASDNVRRELHEFFIRYLPMPAPWEEGVQESRCSSGNVAVGAPFSRVVHGHGHRAVHQGAFGEREFSR